MRSSPPASGTDADPGPGAPRPGEVVGFEAVERLRDFLPPEIWQRRERFFFEGMAIRIGPCFRDYSPPGFYREATRRFAGRVRLDTEGRLRGHRAGLPFPPRSIEPDDPRAALRWAWNWVQRYAGAGEFGSLRLTVVNPGGAAERWEGDHFFVQLSGRSERPEDGFRQPTKTTARWVAGGTSKNLRTGNQCAFRQYASGGRRPDFFVASSGMRKLRRQVAADSDAALSACLADARLPAGLVTHGGEPHLYRWRVGAVRDLLAPINASEATYPLNKDRGYGPWGISFANDRWELRRVIRLDGTLKQGRLEDGTTRFVWYLDLQTLHPVYYAAYRQSGRASGIGIFVSQWSEDRRSYPRWPDDPERPIRVLDEIGAAFVDWNDQYAVRIETGDRVSVPPSDRKLQRMLSLSRVRVH